MHTQHTLKCWPDQFAALTNGDKPFEFRRDDRDYKVGDTLRLEEFDPETGAYTGQHETRTVTYTLRASFGVPEGYVVMGLVECLAAEEEGCFACGEALLDGDPVYWTDGGHLHALCCGPERESFINADEAPLVDGEPVPRPLIWRCNPAKTMQIVGDEDNNNICCIRFSQIMRGKLHQAAAKGRSGWDDPTRCTMEDLSAMLHEHVAKGDPVDVANFAMMIHTRGGRILPAGTNLSAWAGWDARGELRHQDAVCAAVFGPTWSMEDAATLIAFIERTWAEPAVEHAVTSIPTTEGR